MAAAAAGDGVTGARTGIATRSSITGTFTWATAIGGAATMPRDIVRPAIIQGTQATVHHRIPGTGVRLPPNFRRPAGATLYRLDPAMVAELAPATVDRPRYRPIREIVRGRSRVRGQPRRELSRAPGQPRRELSPAPDPLRNRANDPRPSRRVRILFLDRREAAHRALAEIKAWPPKAVVEEAGVASSLAAPPYL